MQEQNNFIEWYARLLSWGFIKIDGNDITVHESISQRVEIRESNGCPNIVLQENDWRGISSINWTTACIKFDYQKCDWLILQAEDARNEDMIDYDKENHNPVNLWFPSFFNVLGKWESEKADWLIIHKDFGKEEVKIPLSMPERYLIELKSS